MTESVGLPHRREVPARVRFRLVCLLTAVLCGAAANPGWAQQMTLLTGHDGGPLLDVERASLSRDGRTLLVFANGRRVDPTLPDATHLVVLRTGQTAPVFAKLLPENANQGRLSSDGNHIVYRGRFSTAYTVVERTLDTGVERTTYVVVARSIPTVIDLSESGDFVAVLDTDFAPASEVHIKRPAYPSTDVPMSAPCPSAIPQADAADTSELSADGSTVAFLSLTAVQKGITRVHAHAIGNTLTGAAECVLLNDPRVYPSPAANGERLSLSRTGRFVAGTATEIAARDPSRAFVLDRSTRLVQLIGSDLIWSRVHGLSEDGRHVLITGQPLTSAPARLYVVDRLTGMSTDVSSGAPVPFLGTQFELSGDGSTVLFQTTSLLEGRRTYLVSLDVDGDGLHDAWETAFGLNPSTAADASLDPDNDGRTNAQEYADGTHPNGTPVRYFAEGADGQFFATSLALFNPSATPATVNVRFLGPAGATASRPVTLAAQTSAYLDVSTLGLPFTEFSIVVESAAPVVAERRVTWDRTEGYGLHTGNGVAAPATQWHFAEGATIAGIQTFLLLQNPGTAPAAVTTRYLLANGTTQERQHVVPASSRLTVWVNQEGTPLDAAEFATTVISDVPIVAERATYRDAASKTFGAGSVAAGVATPSTTWMFAEGATGSYFDTFLLLANPGSTPATVRVDYLRADSADVLLGFPLSRSYVVAPGQRRTVWVDQEAPELANVAVSSRVTSDVPIVAERAMWWPGPTAATWHGTHVGTGDASPGLMWAIADAEVDIAGDTDTFITVGHLGFRPAQLRVTVHLGDGRHIAREFAAANRHTVWPRFDFPETVGQRFSLTVESLEVFVGPPGPNVTRGRVPLSVETVMYRNGFEAGDVSLATRLPDPIE